MDGHSLEKYALDPFAIDLPSSLNLDGIEIDLTECFWRSRRFLENIRASARKRDEEIALAYLKRKIADGSDPRAKKVLAALTGGLGGRRSKAQARLSYVYDVIELRRRNPEMSLRKASEQIAASMRGITCLKSAAAYLAREVRKMKKMEQI